MNNNWNRSDGNTVWSFLLAVFVMVCVFALGLNVKDALTAPSQNYRNIAETDIETQKAAYDLLLYREKTEAEIDELHRQQEAAALKQAQDAEFRAKMLNAVVIGAEALFIGFAVAVAAYGVSNNFRRAEPQPISREAPRARTVQPQPARASVKTHGPRTRLGQLAREEEIRQRGREIQRREAERRLQELFQCGPAIWKADDPK